VEFDCPPVHNTVDRSCHALISALSDRRRCVALS
jgi:hypothetical protein